MSAVDVDVALRMEARVAVVVMPMGRCQKGRGGQRGQELRSQRLLRLRVQLRGGGIRECNPTRRDRSTARARRSDRDINDGIIRMRGICRQKGHVLDNHNARAPIRSHCTVDIYKNRCRRGGDVDGGIISDDVAIGSEHRDALSPRLPELERESSILPGA